ncbi:hypothetical protein C8A05DRAFT_39021 [Staphylotrichum tortipilum]|uniref:Uncharacterized protein n=1 Tax=Staphylotrichum tortipilum TaxID=2831512 RepID=A0AAN6MAX6_9PEZI|nr:hypothetical protein C8A05DRAFT_39021 [Staphylotrichum longicolle]
MPTPDPSTPSGLGGLDPGDARHYIAAMRTSGSRASSEQATVLLPTIPSQSPLANKSNPFVQTANGHMIGNNNALGEQEEEVEPQFRNVSRRLFRASDLMEDSPPPRLAPKGYVNQAADAGTKRSLAYSQIDFENNESMENNKRIRTNYYRESNRKTQNREISAGMGNINNRPTKGPLTRNIHPTYLPPAFLLQQYLNSLFPHGTVLPVVSNPLLKSSLALFPTLPVCFDEGAMTGRLYCPVNTLGEPDPHWKVFPPNPDYPGIPGHGTINPLLLHRFPDTALPFQLHTHHLAHAHHGTLFADTVATLNASTALVDACEFDDAPIPQDVLDRLLARPPRVLKKKGVDPFMGFRGRGGRLARREMDEMLGVSGLEGRELGDGVVVPAVMPRTIWRGTRFERGKEKSLRIPRGWWEGEGVSGEVGEAIWDWEGQGSLPHAEAQGEIDIDDEWHNTFDIDEWLNIPGDGDE